MAYPHRSSHNSLNKCRMPLNTNKSAVTANRDYHLTRSVGSACRACFHSANTFIAHCVDFSMSELQWVIGLLCHFWILLGNELETTRIPVSQRAKLLFLPFGGSISLRRSLRHLEHFSTLGQEQSIKLPMHRQKQPGLMELLFGSSH